MSLPVELAYVASLALIWGIYAATRRKSERRAELRLAEAHEAGLTEPASLHPVIDPTRCLACGACVRACPEGGVLGLIDGRAQLVEPANCIGHGACREACPFDAIGLVFGTERRGVEIPHVGPDFQTNVPGLLIAGELGGMGLIRNAVEQGRQAVDTAASIARQARHPALDLVIVGAGPAGIAASLAAREKGLRFVTLEQETFGGTVAHFPRGKIIMTSPVSLPLVGQMRFREVSKEQLLAFWADILKRIALPIYYGERVERVRRGAAGLEVDATRGTLAAAAVLLAIGRRGTPRKLDVPGEAQSKVVYRLVDPEQYRGRHVLVVGGGDSALEAALAIAEQKGAHVTLSYRGAAFSRCKAKNRTAIDAAAQSGRVDLRLGSKVVEIGSDAVVLDAAGTRDTIRNDVVIVCAGGILPTGFLRNIGVAVETKHGTA